MVKHSRRNIKHKKNSSRRNIKLKNPKHRKKRATSFRKKPFNLRRSTLKKRQHGGATLADLQALNNLLPANNNNPVNWTLQNNPFNNMSLNDFQQFKDEVNRILTEQRQAGLPHINNFAGRRRVRLRSIKTFIDNNEAAIRVNIAQQAPAPVPPPNQGQIMPATALGANPGLGGPPPAMVQPPLANPGLGGPPPAMVQPPLANQAPIGPGNAVIAANQVPVPAAVNPVPAAVNPVPAAVNPVPAAVNPGPAAVNPAPAAAIAAAAAGLPQTITINITTPPNTIRDLRGDAQLNQNNLAQVDISLAQLVQDFAR
jgi:hypothetical protein